MAFVTGLPELTLATMPLRIIFRTAGTPTINESRKVGISEFRTEASRANMACRGISLPLHEEVIFESEIMVKENIKNANGLDEVDMSDANVQAEDLQMG